MFFFAPKALMRFLKALMSADKLREKPSDSKRNRQNRLKKKGKAGYSLRPGQKRLNDYGVTVTSFEPEPLDESPRTALALLAEDAKFGNRRSLDPTVRAAVSNTFAVQETAALVNDQDMILELDNRSDQISLSLENDMARLDEHIDYALRQDGDMAPDLAETTSRLLAGNQAEIDRLMTRVEQIEKAAQAVEAQATAPVAPWWITQMRRQTAATGPARPAPAQPHAPQGRVPQAATNPYSSRTVRPAVMPGRLNTSIQAQSPRQVDPAMRNRLQNVVARRPQKPGLSPTAAAKVAAQPKASLQSRILAMPGRGMHLLSRFAHLREKANEVRHEMSEAEHNFLLELQQRKENQKRERKLNRKAQNNASAPKPRAPGVMSDPTKVG